ncbi:MAG: DUF3501 family protein [Acidobacteria bacterium]|nr:DUF3501 family protein [Acidobacteriota bacterium]
MPVSAPPSDLGFLLASRSKRQPLISAKKVLAVNPTCSYTLRKEYTEMVGTEAARKVSTARFDDRQIASDRISSVQYLKFQLSPEQIRRWREGAKLVADHPSYRAARVLREAEIDELAADLA